MTAFATDDTSRGPEDIQTPEDFAAALTTLRLQQGMSIRALSAVTKVPAGTLGGYFGGRHLPNSTQWAIFRVVLQALGVTEDRDLGQWQAALARVRKGRANPTASSAVPYRGLEPFSESEAPLFFGREAVVGELRRRVEELRTGDQQRLWWLIGPSGSGKSSLLRAGLLASLTESTRAVVIVPGTTPTVALEAALADVEARSGDSRLVVVDQAEELFSPEVDAASRKHFLRRLIDLSSPDDPEGCVFVLGLRADFYGQAASELDLLPTLRSCQTLLGAMSEPELRDAITRPAEAVGVAVAPELVDLVLKDVSPARIRVTGNDPGALPLVSHCLLSAWQHRSGDRLTVGDYLAAGGLTGAVKQSAETVLAGLDEAGQAATQWLFTQLVVVDGEGAMTRRRIDQQALRHPDRTIDRELDGVIEAFIRSRLLTAGESTLEISHEALLTAWPRLYEWVLSDLDAARLQSRIAEAAALWERNDRDPDMLWRGGPLLDAEVLAARPATSARTLTASESAFVKASAQRAADERKRERSRSRRLRSMLVLATVLALLVSVFAGVAVLSRNASTEARDVARANQLAVTADTLAVRDPAAAAQLALAGYETASTVPARSSLLDSTSIPTPVRFVGPPGEMHATGTLDASLIAVSSKDGTTRIWRREESGAYAQASELPASGVEVPGPIWASGFSPDGRTLVTADVGDGAGTILFWDVSAPGAPTLRDSREVQGSPKAMSFSPDGNEVAIGTSIGKVYRFAEGEVTQTGPAGRWSGEVTALAYSPGGGTVMVGTSAGDLVSLDGPDGASIKVRDHGVGTEVTGIAYHPEGTELATSQKSGDVRLWTVARDGTVARAGAPFGDFASWVNGVAYSTDGSLLAAASSDGHVKLFQQRQTMADLTTPSNATSVQFVARGRGLLTSEVGGTARLWTLPLPVLTGFDDAVWGLAVSDASQTMMVAPGLTDGTVRMYRMDPVAGPIESQVLSSGKAGPTDGAAGMSTDGTWVAAGTVDGHVAVWERRGQRYEPAAVVRSGEDLIESVAISPNGEYLAAVGDAALLSVWKLRAGRAPVPVDTQDIGGIGLSVAFDPSGQRLAVGTGENSVRLWDVSQENVTPAQTLTGFSNYVYGLSFSPDGRFIAAGSADQSVRLWDVSESGNPQPVGEPLQGPGGTVYGLAWNREGTALAAASKDGSVWLWDTATVQAPQLTAALKGQGGELYAVTFDDDGRVRAGGVDQQVTTWETNASDVAAATCARTGTALSGEEWDRLVPDMAYSSVCTQE